MATKVKPSRLQVSGTPQVGNVPVYVNEDCFQWGAGGGGGCSQWGCITGTLCDQTDLQGALDCKQDKACMVCNLTSPDNSHYPSAKAVADALSCAGAGDMLKSVYDPNNVSADAFDYCNFINTPTIPTDNCQLANGCGYTTCTGTVVAADLTPYALAANLCTVATSGKYCDLSGTPTIPTDNCQLANGCGYTTCTGTVSTCADVISALGYTPYSAGNPCNYINNFAGVISALGYTPYNTTNPCGYTTCTGTLTSSDLACYACCCDIPTDNCQLSNGCGYTTCTGTVTSADLTSYVLESCVACINGCCLTQGGDICIQGGGGGSIEPYTQAGYEALPSSKLTDGVWRLIYE